MRAIWIGSFKFRTKLGTSIIFPLRRRRRRDKRCEPTFCLICLPASQVDYDNDDDDVNAANNRKFHLFALIDSHSPFSAPFKWTKVIFKVITVEVSIFKCFGLFLLYNVDLEQGKLLEYKTI